MLGRRENVDILVDGRERRAGLYVIRRGARLGESGMVLLGLSVLVHVMV